MFDFFSKKTPQKLRVLKKGHADRVVFFYPTEEGTYIEDVYVTLFENGIFHMTTENEDLTTHLQNCEIIWKIIDINEQNPDKKLKTLHLLKRFEQKT
jgi:hypothetical protein